MIPHLPPDCANWKPQDAPGELVVRLDEEAVSTKFLKPLTRFREPWPMPNQSDAPKTTGDERRLGTEAENRVDDFFV
jgi:hypothetical protein